MLRINLLKKIFQFISVSICGFGFFSCVVMVQKMQLLKPGYFLCLLQVAQKVLKNAKQACQRLGQYRMPFAWAAR